MEPSDPAFKGQRHYTPLFLAIYDLLVLRLYGPWVWRCPTSVLVQHYTRYLGQRHLDVGPGTGYFLAHARMPHDFSVVLMDPNRHVLTHASGRLKHLGPAVVQADVCKPQPLDRRFDSVALNYVLHCLPGPVSRRVAAIRNVAAVLEPAGTLFGATLLGTPGLHTRLSLAALRENNRRGFFDNLDDSEESLHETLSESFEEVDLHIVGSVAVFSAAKPLHLAS